MVILRLEYVTHCRDREKHAARSLFHKAASLRKKCPCGTYFVFLEYEGNGDDECTSTWALVEPKYVTHSNTCNRNIGRIAGGLR